MKPKRLIPIIGLCLLLATGAVLATITSETTRISYAGNGSTTVFAYPFTIIADADLLVIIRDASGNETTQTLTTHYTVSGAGVDGGGNVTMGTAPASTETLTIMRDRALKQESDWATGGAFLAETLEDDIDELTMIVQQLQEQLNRAIHVKKTSGLTDLEISDVTAGEYLRWNLQGTGIDSIDQVSDLGTFLQSGTGAVSRTAASKMGEAVSVEDFGAIPGDAVDDTAAFQAAIDSGAYNIEIAEGTFIVGKVTIPTQIKIQGSHISRTILQLANGTNDHLFSLASKQWVTVSDLTLNGNSANNSSTSNGINASNSVSCTFERVRITDFNDYGVYVDTGNDITFKRCWFDTNTYGLYATSSEQINLDKCVIQENATYGVQYVSALVGAVSEIRGCWFENPTATPTDFIIVDSDNLHIAANKFNLSGCSNSAIRVKTGALYNHILSNVLHQTDPTYGIVFDSGAKYNFAIGNQGFSGGATTDNDGENYILELDSTTAAIDRRGRLVDQIITIAANDTTPSVAKGNYFRTSANTGATAITDFDDGDIGQEITVSGGSDTNASTMASGAELKLSGAMTLGAYDSIILQMMPTGKWQELSRTTWDGG